MIGGRRSKSLKDQYGGRLWLTIAANVSAFGAVAQWHTITTFSVSETITRMAGLLPVGAALIVAVVANGVLSAPTKDRLVFLRWTHALPGHRAFSHLMRSDSRIDQARLTKALGNKLPATPEAENAAWYQIFKAVEAAPEVQHSHRDFLFTRDYAALSAIFWVVFSVAVLFTSATWTMVAVYSLLLIAQFALVRHAAATYGRRFVCTVLSVRSAKPSRAAALRQT